MHNRDCIENSYRVTKFENASKIDIFDVIIFDQYINLKRYRGTLLNETVTLEYSLLNTGKDLILNLNKLHVQIACETAFQTAFQTASKPTRPDLRCEKKASIQDCYI